MSAKSMVSPGEPTAEDLVQAVIRCWPETAAVFVAYRMACVGCAMAPYVTVREAAASYGIDAEALARDLARAAKPGHNGAPVRACWKDGPETG